MEEKIIAVFGGSFNPPIISHFMLAEQIVKIYKNVVKVIFVPVNSNYEKSGLIEDKYRYEMLKLGCKNQPNFEVLDIEIKQKEKTYTLKTLNKIKEMYKEETIYFIIGTDNLKELESWYKAEELVKRYKFFVLERDEDDFNKIIENSIFLKDNRNSFINLEKIKKIKLSSTLVREKIKRGEEVEDFVPNEIMEYIKKNNLYKTNLKKE